MLNELYLKEEKTQKAVHVPLGASLERQIRNTATIISIGMVSQKKPLILEFDCIQSPVFLGLISPDTKNLESSG